MEGWHEAMTGSSGDPGTGGSRTPAARRKAPAEWFKEWFGETYLKLYPHRDEEEAAMAVALYRDRARLAEDALVLDLACGAGRHIASFRAAGVRTVGIDLSAPLLRTARERPAAAGRLVRGDMRRLPFGDASFGGLVNFFTSFGYFSSPEEDIQVVREASRVLRSGAPFLIDYMNVENVVRQLDPESVSEISGATVRQSRWVERDQVFKRIEVRDRTRETVEEYHERVRLYSREELAALLHDHGLETEDVFGGYDGAPFDETRSSRLLLFGRAL